MRSEYEINRAIDSYADTVKRICILHLKNEADTEDVFQEVFLKYALSADIFKDSEHEKAWIIRVTINQCKDLIKSFFRRRTVPIDEITSLHSMQTADNSEVLEAVLRLPPKYKNIVYLYYYEGYSAVEIAQMLDKNVNTVYTMLSRAKVKLKSDLGGDEFE